MLRLTLLLLALLMMFSMLATGARAIGQQETPLSAHLDNGDCLPPCWHGIKPGESDRYEVDRLVNQWIYDRSVLPDNPYMGRTAGAGNDLELFALHTDGSGLQLDAVVRQFGFPEEIGCMCGCSLRNNCAHLSNSGSGLFVALLYFEQKQVEVEVVIPYETGRLAPDIGVYGVCYFSRPLATPTSAWQGLSRVSRYPICREGCLRNRCTYVQRLYTLEPPG
jgi:hypothetical protein